MPDFADARRWVKDRFAKDDPELHGHPKDMIKNAEKVLRWNESENRAPTADERTRHVDYLRGQAILYYPGRHNQAIPKEVMESLQKLDQRVARLNMVDAAREVVKSYGGPPTQATIDKSLNATYEKISEAAKLRAHDHVRQREQIHEPARAHDSGSAAPTAPKAKAATKDRSHAIET